MAVIDSSVYASATINGDPVELLNFSVADDSLQQNGLVKCRGNMTCIGAFTPAVNSVVKISYNSKDGFSETLPRTFRILSSFANPFTRRTQIEIGCKLTYLANSRPPVENPKPVDEFPATPQDVLDRSFVNISASFIFQQCLTALGLTSSTIPLKSTFAVEEFDLGSGYVDVMEKLLQSESYVGYLDENEVLQIRSLQETGGNGPVLIRERIIEIGAIGSGQLPGEAVVVGYNSKKLKEPKALDDESWLKDLLEVIEVRGPVNTLYETELINGQQVESTYRYQEYSYVRIIYDIQDRELSRKEFRRDEAGETERETRTSYPNENVSRSRSVEIGPTGKVIDACGFDLSVFPTRGSKNIGTSTINITEYETKYYDITNTTTKYTRSYIPYIFTPTGKKAISLEAVNRGQATYPPILAAASVLVADDNTQEVTRGRNQGNTRPSKEDLKNDALSKGPDTNSETLFEWTYGSPESTNYIRFDLPYTPDDSFTWNGTSWDTLKPSNAAAVAATYGRVQNKILLGNRSGMNIVTVPKFLPRKPFDVFYVNLYGFMVEYRLNRMAWTGDAQKGVVVTCDACFWGTVGADPGALISDAWAPLPPGAISLPPSPATTPDPQYGAIVNAPYSIPAYNETLYSGGFIKLSGIYRPDQYPITIILDTGYIEIAANDLTPLSAQTIDLDTGYIDIDSLDLNAAIAIPVNLDTGYIEISSNPLAASTNVINLDTGYIEISALPLNANVSGTRNYFNSWVEQNYGFKAEWQVSWWGS